MNDDEWKSLEMEGLQLLRDVALCVARTDIRLIDQTLVPFFSKSVSLGCISPLVDECVRPYLKDVPKGRFIAIVYNRAGIEMERSFSEERIIGIWLHELAHALSEADLYFGRHITTPVEDPARIEKFVSTVPGQLMTDYRTLAGTDLQCEERWTFESHDDRFIRASIHLCFRARQFRRWRWLGLSDLCGFRPSRIRISDYMRALGNEPERMHMRPFSEILSTLPPNPFTELWEQDKVEFELRQLQPEACQGQITSRKEPQMLEELLSEVKQAEHEAAERQAAAESEFQRLRDRLVNREAVSPKTVKRILDEAGKTSVDLQNEIARINRRRRLIAIRKRAKEEYPKANKEVLEAIAANEAELNAARLKYDNERRTLANRSKAVNQIKVEGDEAERDLRNIADAWIAEKDTAIGREIIAVTKSREFVQRQLEALLSDVRMLNRSALDYHKCLDGLRSRQRECTERAEELDRRIAALDRERKDLEENIFKE